MILRNSGDLRSLSGLRLGRPKLAAVLAGAAAVLLTMLAGGSGAGIAQYQGTLYFAGPASAISGSYQLTTTAPGAQGLAPVAVAGVPAGSGGLATGAYRWIYVTSSGGALTASATSNQLSIAMPGNTPALVSNVPVGADVYRATIPGGTSTGKYTYVGTNPGPTTTYTDTNTSTAGAALPQADTRVPASTMGWMPFIPGSSFSSSGGVSSVSGTTPSIPSSCTGWTVDSSAGFSFPAGTWTFNAQVRPDGAANGAAVLTAAMWKVDTSGNTISGGTIVPVTDGGAMALNGMSQNVSVSYTTTTAATVDTNERLCVQFWRHQTTGTTSLGASNRTVWMLAYDPNNRISVHPAPNALPSSALTSPADGLHTQTIPTLGATYSDAEADPGNVTIRVCSESSCATPLQNSGSLAANDGETKTWTPSGLGDGTYYWQAQAQDAGGAPAWTSSRSFVLDNAPPTITIAGPPAQSNATSGSFSFSANESVTGYECRLDGAAYASCTSPHGFGPLADGAHTFDVKAVADLAGNAGTPASYGWTIDTVPPNTSITSNPALLSNDASPSFGFSATQMGSSFECSLDGGGFGTCTDPKSYSGLLDGAHTFQVHAIDLAGNVDPSPASYAWTIDATPPDTSIGPSFPAALTIATGATFDFSSTESPASFECSRDGAAFTACSSPKTYSALADGSHTFQVHAIDNASNTDPTPASYAWTIDTTPPVTSIGPTTPPANTPSSSATFDLASNEPGSTFECRLDGAGFAPCTTPMNYAGLADGTHVFDLRATDPVGNVDTSPASYIWTIDNVAPSTPPLTAPADGLSTSTLPQLQATFNDATLGGDTGTVEFQLCSISAPAGTACVPVVQSVTSGSVSSGATASAMPAALADGTYHWQARAQDAAGNQSGWSATRSFQLDTVLPTVTPGTPADGAWVSSALLTATFSKASFAGTGSVEFRICSDALCLGIVKSGSSGMLINGASGDWTPSPPADGLYYWQARAHDSSGNVSAWSASRVLHLDSVAPGKPLNFNGQLGADGLTLRWQAPSDTVANYVVYVNGAPWKNLGGTELEVKIGLFEVGDTRTFSVVAVDLAGNVGVMSPVLVGVPNLLGLTWPQALGATSVYGLALRRSAASFTGPRMLVTGQEPVVPALVERGSAVVVTLTPPRGGPPGIKVKPGRFACAGGSVLRPRVLLSDRAGVRTRLLNKRGRVVKRGNLGTLRPGATKVRIKLPRGLHRGSYRLMFDATAPNGRARALVRVKVGSRVCRGR
jgi:Big-like domain-containing protein